MVSGVLTGLVRIRLLPNFAFVRMFKLATTCALSPAFKRVGRASGQSTETWACVAAGVSVAVAAVVGCGKDVAVTLAVGACVGATVGVGLGAMVSVNTVVGVRLGYCTFTWTNDVCELPSRSSTMKPTT